MQTNDIVKSYTDLIQILSSTYDLEVRSGVLYGKNRKTGKIYLLAKREGAGFLYTPIEGIRGFILINFICQKFNLSLIPNEDYLKIDKKFEAMVKKYFSILNRGKTYIEI